MDTHQLQHHYPSVNYRQAYDDLRRFFKDHIYALMDELVQLHPWIGICVKKMDVTNVGRQHDLKELLKLTGNIIIDNSHIMHSVNHKKEGMSGQQV